MTTSRKLRLWNFQNNTQPSCLSLSPLKIRLPAIFHHFLTPHFSAGLRRKSAESKERRISFRPHRYALHQYALQTFPAAYQNTITSTYPIERAFLISHLLLLAKLFPQDQHTEISRIKDYFVQIFFVSVPMRDPAYSGPSLAKPLRSYR